jgi:hypothetical protein
VFVAEKLQVPDPRLLFIHQQHDARVRAVSVQAESVQTLKQTFA